MVKRSSWVIGPAILLVLICQAGCERKIAQEIVKETESKADVLIKDGQAEPVHPRPNSRKADWDPVLEGKIKKQMKRCAIAAPEEALKEVIKEGIKAAYDAVEEPKPSDEEVRQAAYKAATKSADNQGAALPVGFLDCALLEPVMRSYTACGGKAGCFKTNLFSERE